MKGKFLGLVLSTVMVGSLLVGCGGTADSASGNTADEVAAEETKSQEAGDTDKTYKIGFSQCTLASPFYTEMKTVAETYAKEKGVELTVVSANDDVQKQNNDIMDLVSGGIDALILNPINTEGVLAGIQNCAEKNIPVITVDRMAASGATAAVVRDNKEMGNIVGKALLEQLGGAEKASGVILEIQGTSGDQVMMDRRDGFESAFEGVEGIKIVQSAYCDYTRSKAITATQDLIQANDNIVAVYGHNDDMSLGAMQACQEAGLDNVLVCGVDGLMEAVKAIDGGNYACTALNDPGSELKIAIDTCISVLNGDSVEEKIDAGTGLVDASNAKDYISDERSFAAMN